MRHPFYKILNKALNKSSLQENFVIVEAEKLRQKGYSPKEIYGLLKLLSEGLIDDTHAEIVTDALEKFSEYVD